MDNELMAMFASLSRSHDERESTERNATEKEHQFNQRAQLAESLAQELPGFNADRDDWLGPLNGHTNEARAFIHGFAGMPIKHTNPRADGASVVEAFNAGAAKRREMGV